MDLHPSLPPKGLRSKVLLATTVVLAIVFGLNPVGAALWPDYARFFPPTMLSMVMVVTAVYALMVWRREWVVAKLFPGQPVPPVRSYDRISVWVSIALTVVLTVAWIRSMLTS